MFCYDNNMFYIFFFEEIYSKSLLSLLFGVLCSIYMKLILINELEDWLYKAFGIFFKYEVLNKSKEIMIILKFI